METVFNKLASVSNFESFSVVFLPEHTTLMWVLILGNAVLALMYILIPIQVLNIYFKRKDFPFQYIFLKVPLLGFFFAAGHIVMIICFWYPLFYLRGAVDALSAIVSLTTLVALIPAAYQVLEMSGPEHLEGENAKLRIELEKHANIKRELALKNMELQKTAKHLSKKNEEMEAINKLMISQELKMIDLKEQIKNIKT